MAIQAAVSTFRESGADPLSVGAIQFEDRRANLNLLWGYYRNSVFDSLSAWQKYRESYVLYNNIRSLYNPTRRLVNFYVAQVYPGVLSEDASQLPDGIQLAIPLSKDTPDKLKMVIAQFWQWSNWQSNNKLMVRYGGATGSSLVEILDDVERGKISAVVTWPGKVADLELDDVGNVKMYALEYDALDENEHSYKYRKEVTKESFTYFKDDAVTSEDENFYGFIPAVWCKHIDEGNDFGSPAISGSIAKIDEINGLASHVHDHIDRVIESPGVLSSDSPIGLLGQATPRTTSDEYDAVTATREKNSKLRILRAKAGTTWTPMVGNLDPEKTIPHMEKLLAEIEHDFPELSMYQELRKMSQVTGPAAARLMGDVSGRLTEVSANYDTQSIKLFQMAAAIGGFRFKEGKDGWKLKTEQQKKFSPFGLDSYAKGELSMAIMPRPLIPMTEADTIELTGKRLENAAKADGLFSEDKRLELAGVSDPVERATILAARREVDVIPEVAQ